MKKAPVIKPARLSRGDQVGVIAPAGPVSASDLQPCLKILESSGFRVRLAPNVYNRQGYLAGNDEERLKDLHTLFQDQDIKAIFCARGGYGSLRLLDKIRYDMIKENPKIFVGYSDVTALLLAIHGKTGLVTFHGPMVREFASRDQGNWEDLLRIVSYKQAQKLILANGTPLIPGKATGPLIGGNLSLICHLLGTPFLPSLFGCVLFIEERGEPLYRLDRMLTHLALSGELRGISGLIAGSFEGCGDMSAISRLLLDIFSGFDIPLAIGLPVGHGPRNLALPLGLTAELDTELMTLSMIEQCVNRPSRKDC